MDRSRAQHNQDMGNNETLESMLICTKKPQQEKKAKPHAEQALKCPRCESTNTKFCYYNNYSLTQPRYFCKSCRRYWTQGGTLRNVPVGGSFRKNNKRSSSSSSSSSKISRSTGQEHLIHNHLIPSLTYDSNHDHLALATFPNFPMRFDDHDQVNMGNYHLESAMNLQNLYYGDHQIGMGSSSSSSGGMMTMAGLNMVDQEMVGIPFEELSGMGEDMSANNRVLWGFPWKFAGEDGDHNNNIMNMVADCDQRGMISTWNGVGSSSSNWHGLLNSPLI